MPAAFSGWFSVTHTHTHTKMFAFFALGFLSYRLLTIFVSQLLLSHVFTCLLAVCVCVGYFDNSNFLNVQRQRRQLRRRVFGVLFSLPTRRVVLCAAAFLLALLLSLLGFLLLVCYSSVYCSFCCCFSWSFSFHSLRASASLLLLKIFKFKRHVYFCYFVVAVVISIVIVCGLWSVE